MNFEQPKVRHHRFLSYEIADFDLYEGQALLFCLTRYIGKIEVLNLKNLRPIKAFNLHTPSKLSWQYNKIKIHKASGSFCCLQAQKLHEAVVFICNYKTNTGVAIPYEYSNSSKAIALYDDFLITAGSSSRIRFWDIYKGHLADEINLNINSLSISNVTPFQEKQLLVCTEETTSSLWIVSFRTKKLMRAIPLDGAQQVISKPLGNEIACLSNNYRAIRFWKLVEKGSQRFDLEPNCKQLWLNCFGNFLFNDSDEKKKKLLIYTHPSGIKYQDLSTNMITADLKVSWRRKFQSNLPLKQCQIKDRIMFYDGANLLVVN